MQSLEEQQTDRSKRNRTRYLCTVKFTLFCNEAVSINRLLLTTYSTNDDFTDSCGIYVIYQLRLVPDTLLLAGWLTNNISSTLLIVWFHLASSKSLKFFINRYLLFMVTWGQKVAYYDPLSSTSILIPKFQSKNHKSFILPFREFGTLHKLAINS